MVGRCGGNCIKSCRIKAVAKTEVTQLVFLCVPAETFPYATNYAIRHILLFFFMKVEESIVFCPQPDANQMWIIICF